MVALRPDPWLWRRRAPSPLRHEPSARRLSVTGTTGQTAAPRPARLGRYASRLVGSWRTAGRQRAQVRRRRGQVMASTEASPTRGRRRRRAFITLGIAVALFAAFGGVALASRGDSSSTAAPPVTTTTTAPESTTPTTVATSLPASTSTTTEPPTTEAPATTVAPVPAQSAGSAPGGGPVAPPFTGRPSPGAVTDDGCLPTTSPGTGNYWVSFESGRRDERTTGYATQGNVETLVTYEYVTGTELPHDLAWRTDGTCHALG